MNAHEHWAPRCSSLLLLLLFPAPPLLLSTSPLCFVTRSCLKYVIIPRRGIRPSLSFSFCPPLHLRHLDAEFHIVLCRHNALIDSSDRRFFLYDVVQVMRWIQKKFAKKERFPLPPHSSTESSDRAKRLRSHWDSGTF